MQTRIVVGGVLAALTLGATGVGVAVAGSGGTAAAAPAYGSGHGGPRRPSAPSAPSPATVTNRNTNLGPTLVDGPGRTLYLFESDTPTVSTCNGSRARVWAAPPPGPPPHAHRG